MELQPVTVFDVTDVNESSDKEPTLTLQNIQTRQEVTLPGAILEAQYSFGENYLLFVTYNSPFEEALSIYYLNAQLETLDALELSAWYTTGDFKDLKKTAQNELQFKFFGEEEGWTLQVLLRPKFKLFSSFFVKRHHSSNSSLFSCIKQLVKKKFLLLQES